MTLHYPLLYYICLPASCSFKQDFKENMASNEGIQDYGSPQFTPQPPEVDTKEKCLDKCLNQNQDLPPSTESCLSADFEYSTKRCRLMTSPHGVTQKEGSVYIQLRYSCHASLYPGEKPTQ